MIESGEWLLTRSGLWVVVERAAPNGEVVTVYNFEVAEYHTYFLGEDSWGFDLWTHNSHSGGAKRGPKTDPNAPHNKKVREEGDKIVEEGGTIIAGGGREPEKLIKTPGGTKEGRRPDIIYEPGSGGPPRGRNIGRQRKDRTPIKREGEAIDDLKGPGKLPMDPFVPYI
jgi:hypothetical protein